MMLRTGLEENRPDRKLLMDLKRRGMKSSDKETMRVPWNSTLRYNK